MLAPSLQLRKRRGATGDDPGREQRRDTGEQSERERPIVCASCGHSVAKGTDRTEVAGRHQHTCVNPHGYVYRIVVFRRAEGVVGAGEWSDVHTWFAGTFWQVACCRSCNIHLGWIFAGEGDDFYGLIADRIDEPR